MNKLRRLHLYLGCFFAPMLILFALSGLWQSFGLGFGYKAKLPERWERVNSFLQGYSSMHMHVRDPFVETEKPVWPQEFNPLELKKKDKFILPYNIFMLGLVIGLVTTTLIGILMAFKSSGRPKLVIVLLIAGVVIPWLLSRLRDLQWKQ